MSVPYHILLLTTINDQIFVIMVAKIRFKV